MTAALLALATAASAARLCGRVEVLGRPLPEGFATVSGPVERGLARIKAGAFCVDGLPEGDYRVEAAPFSQWKPMRAGFKGLPGSTTSYLVRVDASGARLVGGSTLPPLVYLPDPPEPGWATLDGTLNYPKGAAPARALVMAQTAGEGYRFAWTSGRRFRLAVEPGDIGSVVVWAEGWAATRLDPPYSVRGGEALKFKTAQALALRVDLARAGRVAARVRLPDGGPFVPYAGLDPARRSIFGFSLVSPFNGQQFEAYAGEDGVVETAAPEGPWELQPLWRGPGFRWNPGISSLVWIEAGKTAAAEVALSEAAEARVPDGGVAAAPLWQTGYTQQSPVIRRLLGAPAGAIDPRRTFAFFLEGQQPVSFNQSMDGKWEPTAGGGGVWKRAAPGRYDLYLVEVHRWLDYLSSRVLALQRGATIERGGRADLKVGAGDLLALGDEELRGTLKARRRWTLDDVKRARTLIELDQTLFPVVNIYDEQGRFLGLSMPNVTAKEYDSLGELLLARDWAGVEKVYRSFGEFRVERLTPGRYRAQVVVFGYEPKEFPVTVEAGKVARLDVDMDR